MGDYSENPALLVNIVAVMLGLRAERVSATVQWLVVVVVVVVMMMMMMMMISIIVIFKLYVDEFCLTRALD